MKIRLLTIFIVILFSCSSNDDSNNSSIDVTLLYGQWFDVGLCNTQNNITFNQDGSYTRVFSGNTCDNNFRDTYQYTGTYTISGDNIGFTQQTETLIEMGNPGGQPIQDFGVTLINQKIIQLTETQLTIEEEYNVEPIFRNWNLVKQ